jgi:putative heme-binding domain-containing protein
VHDKIEGRLAAYIQARWKQDPAQPLAIRWALLADIPAAYTDLVERIQQTSQTDMLAQYLDLVGPYCQQDLIPHLLTLAVPQQDVKVSTQAISLLGKFNDPQIASHLLEHYGAFPTATQAGIRQILLGRPESALKLVQQVEGQKIAAKDVSAIELRIVALFKNDELNQLVEKLWGRVGPGTPDQKLATMRRFNNDLRNGSGDLVRGRLIYEKQCGSCHKLKGEGKQLGPDLTNENRADRAALLANIVDPSSVVRRDYLSYVITTNSGQVLTGLLAKQDAAAVTLVDAKNNIQRIARTDIDSLAASPLSLMPDGILEKLTPQELCDLFSYLQMK